MLSIVKTTIILATIGLTTLLGSSCKEKTPRTALTGKGLPTGSGSSNNSGDASANSSNIGSNNADIVSDDSNTTNSTPTTTTPTSTTASDSGSFDIDLPGQPNSPDNQSDDDDLFTPEGDKGPGEFSKQFRSSPDFFTRMDDAIKGNSPHGTVQIWYSSNMLDVIDRAAFDAPVGSVAIKTFKSDDQEGIAVMIKKNPGYDPDNNDWRYEIRDVNGVLKDDPKPGKNGTCIECHASAADSDFLAGNHLGVKEEDETIDASDTGDASQGPGTFVKNFKISKDFFTETQAFHDGNSPHGRVKIWYSNNLANLIGNASFTAPVGTVAIKEFDNDQDKGVDGVAIMIKKSPGFDPENGDWHYEMRDQWGDLKTKPAAGKNKECSSCHAAAADTDFLPGTKITSGKVPTDGDGPGKFKADYYSSPLFFTKMSKMNVGKSPHGNTRIWYSSNIENKLGGKGAFTAPVGTVAITRFEVGDKQGLAVMIKQQPGYDATHGDWRYEMRDRYGNLLDSPQPGKVGTCISCHSTFKDSDFLGGIRLNN